MRLPYGELAHERLGLSAAPPGELTVGEGDEQPSIVLCQLASHAHMPSTAAAICARARNSLLMIVPLRVRRARAASA